MGYYSHVDDLSFTSDFNGRLIPLKDWNDLFNNGRLYLSFLTYAIKFNLEMTFSGDYIKGIDCETYDSAKAYELVSELQAFKKFMDDHGITFSMEFTLLGEDNLDVSKYSVSSDLPHVMVAEGVMTFTEFKPARHNPSLLSPL